MKTTIGMLGISTVLLATIACSSTPPSVGGVSPDLFDDSLTVTVVNDNFYDVNVFALYEGASRDRLGMVTGHSSDTFRFAYHPGRLVMWMHLIGVGSTVSDEITVNPGEILELRIMPDMHRRVSRGR